MILRWLFLFLPVFGSAQSHYTFTAQLEEAYEAAISLRLDRSQEIIEKAKAEDPENLLNYYVEDYIDFFRIFITEEKAIFTKALPNKDLRIEKLRSGPEDSPYHLFTRAEVHLHWAAARLKFDYKFEAGREIYKAYHLLKENEERFPDFKENKKSLSIIHSLAASIPAWARTIIGIEGSVELGTQEIEELIQYAREEDNVYYAEAVGIYSYILSYLANEPEKAYQVLMNSGLQPEKSPFICFLMATMAHNTGRNDQAITLLQNRPTGADYLEFDYLVFLLGKYKLYRLDEDAEKYIDMFLNRFGGRHFIKEAYQKKAWYDWVLHDDAEGYYDNMQLLKRKGYALIDEDKSAQNEANTSSLPDRILLRARILFDGGYYEQAHKLLTTHTYSPTHPEYITYLYRLGRTQQALDMSLKALGSFKNVLAIDKSSYMACNAALQCGFIHEDKANFDKAKFFYNLCLDISPENYKESLHQKAKSGLDRIQ